MLRRAARLVAAGLVPMTLLPMTGTAAAQRPSSVAPSGFVSAAGTNLAVGGQPWRFVGYNMPCAQPFILGDSQPFVFANIATNSGANALRMWFYQSNGGPANWAPFDQAIATAKSNGMRIIATLVNEWATCEPVTPSIDPLKGLAWYQTGYKQTGDGYPLSFRDFAVQMATHYANEPTIAFWQLVNEAEAPVVRNKQVSCDEAAAVTALRNFSDDMAAALHAVDHNHLVNLGTLGGSQCGIAGADFATVHGGRLDLCEYHDYNDPLSPLQPNQADGLAARLQQCQSLPGGGKPIFIGEAGIVNNVKSSPPQPALGSTFPPVTFESLNLRASLFHNKITAAFNAGVSGYDIWFKGPAFDSTGDSFSVGDRDPVEAMMKQISLTGPAPAVPETGLSIILPLSAIAVLGGGGGLIWWRRVKRDAATARPG